MLRPDGLPHPTTPVEAYLAKIYDLLRAIREDRPKLHQAASPDPEIVRVKDSRGKK